MLNLPLLWCAVERAREKAFSPQKLIQDIEISYFIYSQIPSSPSSYQTTRGSVRVRTETDKCSTAHTTVSKWGKMWRKEENEWRWWWSPQCNPMNWKKWIFHAVYDTYGEKMFVCSLEHDKKTRQNTGGHEKRELKLRRNGERRALCKMWRMNKRDTIQSSLA